MEQKIKQDDVIRIGQNIGRLRREQNMTQEDMTRELQLSGVSVSRGNYSKIEMGIHHIEASLLEHIRDILGTTYDELLKR